MKMLCPKCGSKLYNWGVGSPGTAHTFVEMGCFECDKVMLKVHTQSCSCRKCKKSKTPTVEKINP